MTFPLRTSQGAHFGTFIQDVTERRRAEVALQENEIFLSNVFRSIQDGISVLDKDLNVIRVNHAMEKWYRHNIPLVGKKCYEVYHGRSEPCESCPSLRTIEHKTMQNEVVPLVGESGPVGWVELYTFPMLDGGGNVIGIIEQVRDITERKRIEDELIAAKQQAELYLDLMGHDINNMHQIALGYLELARDMQADAGQKELLNTPIEVLQRSARLIHNVRKLQRLREGVFQTELVDVCKVVSNVQREFGGVPGKTITLNLNNHEHCYIMANELFHDVISNLVSNAIRHTGNPAEIIIDIDRVVGAGKPCYRIIIEDDGPGIPDDSKGKIFNRMHGGSARGLGLGLYLVKSLVDSYGGRVLAGDRVPGDHTRGAKFVVMLPAAV
jgi:PAS domain S-box-containing protein